MSELSQGALDRTANIVTFMIGTRLALLFTESPLHEATMVIILNDDPVYVSWLQRHREGLVERVFLSADTEFDTGDHRVYETERSELPFESGTSAMRTVEFSGSASRRRSKLRSKRPKAYTIHFSRTLLHPPKLRGEVPLRPMTDARRDFQYPASGLVSIRAAPTPAVLRS